MPKNQSYDCLNVNIYAPITTKPVAVMVFWHGGTFVEGSNQGPFDMYNGSYIASTQNVIVVTMNYRLGSFGFLVTETLDGNFGFLDQQFGLQWVQRNIGVVNGNASAVTIWGESAGAMSVGLHLVAPGSKGLFHQAIMESNVAGYNYRNRTGMREYGRTFCSLLGCASGPKNDTCSTPCMANTTVDAQRSAWNAAAGAVKDFILANLAKGIADGHWLDAFIQWSPMVGGDVLPDEPMDIMASGTWESPVDVLVGTNTNEGDTFVTGGLNFPLPGPLADAAYDLIFGVDNAKRVKARPRYDPSNYPFLNGTWPLSNVLTDYWFRCSTEQFANAAIQGGKTAWVYRFDHLWSQASMLPKYGLPAVCGYLVCHMTELPFTFHNSQNPLNVTAFTPAEAAFSAQLTSWWGSFVSTGNPNTLANQQFQLPAYTPQGRELVVLNLTSVVENTTELCGFWDSLGYFF